MNWYELRKYRGPGLFFGGGILAGFLLFAVWLAMHPSADEKVVAGEQSSSASVALDPLAAKAGVLDDITGGPGAGTRAITLEQGEETDVLADETEAGELAEQATDEYGNVLLPPEPVSDEQAIANGLLDGPAPSEVEAPPPVLQTFYVEVMPDPGVFEMLEVSAESADHARELIRELRGNPRIVRGPSTHPLE
jgi:hypothetical protein